MKNAKMLLAVIAVVTVAGGALAFKAQSRSFVRYCTTSSGTSCSVDAGFHTPATPGTVSYATTLSLSPHACPITCTSRGTMGAAD